jgi:arsenite-transporting ATPase
VRGVDRLRQAVEIATQHTGPTRTIAQTAEGYTLRIPMPNVETGKLSLSKRGDELYVDVGNFRREIPLPVALAMLEPGVARLRQGVLEIPFAQRQAG